MKKFTVFFLLLILGLTSSAQEKIKWISLEEAVAAQANEPRKIIMDMYTTWCGPCKLLDKKTFANTDVASYINKNYYAVKFNAEGGGTVKFKDKEFTNPGFNPSRRGRNSQHQLAGYFGVQAYPTILFIDEKGDLLTPIKGYHNPNQLELFLKIFATNAYKTVNSKEKWVEYQKNFTPEFKL